MQPKLGGGDLFWKSGMHQNNGEKAQLMEINRAELNTGGDKANKHKTTLGYD